MSVIRILKATARSIHTHTLTLDNVGARGSVLSDRHIVLLTLEGWRLIINVLNLEDNNVDTVLEYGHGLWRFVCLD